MTTSPQGMAIVGIASAVVVVACSVWSGKDPRRVAGSVPRDYQLWPDYATTRQIMRERLTPHIGGPFPDLTLIDRRSQVVRLSSLRGHRVAILSAIGPCPASIAWLKQLRTAAETVNGTTSFATALGPSSYVGRSNSTWRTCVPIL